MSDTLEAAQARLNAARGRKRRLSLGPVLRQTDAALDALAAVGEHDLAAAEAFARDAAGEAGVAMLRATREGM